MKYKKQTMREKKLAIQKWFFSTSCRVTMIGLIVLFGVLFVAKVSSVSTKGFEISDLEKSVQELERENQKLNVKIAEHRSMESIQTRLGDMNMVAASNIEYVNLVGNAVAKR
jgi:hypothetical protein